MIYAQIENNSVSNVIVADDISNLEGTYVDITDVVPRPDIGWSYDGTAFSDPNAFQGADVEIPNPQDPIVLSEASGSLTVKFREGKIFVGCLDFDIEFIKKVGQEILIENAPNVGKINATKAGIRYEDFFITWEDIQRIQDFLDASGV